MLWQIFQYIRHQCYLKHRKGYGMHSPYLFDIVSRGIFNSGSLQCPDWVINEHRRLKKDPAPAGNDGRSVSSFVRKASVSEKKGALLHRLVSSFAPHMLVELGAGVGISALYMASAAPGIPLHSIERNTERAAIAAHLVSRCQLGPVSIHWGDMDEKLDDILPVLPGKYFAYVDGNHYHKPTVNYIRRLIEQAGEEAVIVMDDIYWSQGMYSAWKEVISWPEVRASIDLFHMGILLLRKDLHSAHLKIKF